MRVVAGCKGLSADTPGHPLVAWVDVLRRRRDSSRHQGKNSNNIRECELHFVKDLFRKVGQTSSQVQREKSMFCERALDGCKS
jgi:hypothetical protein